jgi:hypothetical protein
MLRGTANIQPGPVAEDRMKLRCGQVKNETNDTINIVKISCEKINIFFIN